MNLPITARLNNRMARIYHKTGNPPKRLSIGIQELPVFKSEVAPGTAFLSVTRRNAIRFCGLPLRVRDYARERRPKFHGPGAQQALPSVQ